MLVGICGIAKSGKDTVGSFLVKNHGFVAIAFADPIKRTAAEWFGWNEDRLWGPSDRRNEPDPRYDGLTARKALQFMGTEIGRNLYPDLWCRYGVNLAKRLLEAKQDGGPAGYHSLYYSPAGGIWHGHNVRQVQGVVITDVRFKNEIKAIREAGGKLVRIVREGAGLQGAAAQHASEAEQLSIPDSEFDHVLDNNGESLEKLEVLVHGLVEVLSIKSRR